MSVDVMQVGYRLFIGEELGRCGGGHVARSGLMIIRMAVKYARCAAYLLLASCYGEHTSAKPCDGKFPIAPHLMCVCALAAMSLHSFFFSPSPAFYETG